MRPCDIDQLALKPFANDSVVLVVGEDSVARKVELGGAGRFKSLPALTLFVSPGDSYPIGTKLTANLLSAGRPAAAGLHFESSAAIPAPRIAESRVAFECVVLARGSLEGDHAQRAVVVLHVLATHQRWPRGCAIT